MEERILTMLPLLNEKQKRIFLATEAMSYGRGGITKVSQISGVSIPTIRRGIKEIKTGSIGEPSNKLRIPGGGRKKTECKYQSMKALWNKKMSKGHKIPLPTEKGLFKWDTVW